jgi:hypothetical protein
MGMRNFSEFLLEKKKDKSESEDTKENSGDPKIWEPGDGFWFLEYLSQIKRESDQVNLVKIEEGDLLKLGKEGFSKIDSSLKWEKLYQFAKYCLKGKEKNYPPLVRDQEKKDSKTLEPGLLSKILEIKVEGKTINGILSKDVKNDNLASYTKGIYNGIKGFVKDTNIADFLFKDDKTPENFDDLGVISLLAGLYQPGQKPLFKTDSTPSELSASGSWNQLKKDGDVIVSVAGAWLPKWSIPIDPLRVEDLIRNSEMCVRASLSCIKEIKILLSESAQEDSESKILEIEGIIKKIKDLREGKLLGLEEEAEGNETGKIYTFWRKRYNEKGELKEIDSGNSIENGDGLTTEMNDEFLQNFKDVKVKISEAKSLVDSGEMSLKEYTANIEEYTGDKEKKSVEVGEGLRKVMYEEIKDGISDLQAAIDNYTSAPGEKNALDQYLKVYSEFIDKTKSQYTITGMGDNKKISISVPEEVEGKGKNKNKNKK